MSDQFYTALAAEARALLEGESDVVANAANLSALLYLRLPDVNWAGFYFMRDGELLVGPFNGKPACTRIALGQGVCGAAMAQQQTLRVPDVHEFAGHIACDAESRSEIVIPLGELGVLDIDSPLPDRFSAADQAGLEQIAAIYLDSISN
ncbi:MAG: GAF domain-containing protein [Gammaproteobacteria bacterium]|nr:GAF domain-containing protein [Gammaproteobacteria bacterium]NNF59986.1 GAF domain-containing protein [Gammaproteobacteria bacterium]NNM21454.1 GAF domain-containing protein [Gammaproteobacteria bacterium]